MGQAWPLVGRDDHLIAIRGATDRAAGVLIVGTHGSGRTRLAREAGVALGPQYARTVGVGATPWTRETPLGAFASRLPELAGVLPLAALVLPGTGDPALLADLLDLALASERVRVTVREGGRAVPWEDLAPAVAWAAALGRPLPEGALVLHDRLRVLVVDDERGGAPVEYTPAAWVDGDGVVHADDPVRGLLAALAP